MTKSSQTFTIDDNTYHAFPTMTKFIAEAGISIATQQKSIRLKLQKEGLDDVSQLFRLTAYDFIRMGIATTQGKKLISHLQILRRRSKLILTGSQLKEQVSNFEYLTTANLQINNALTYSDGKQGLRYGTVTEIYGAAGTGKTQMVMFFALQCIKYGRSVIYIDSEGGFDYTRFLQLAQFWDINLYNVDEQLLQAKVFNFDELEQVLTDLAKELRTRDLGMIIIDSIIDPLKAQYPLDEDLSKLQQRQQHLKQVMDQLKSIAQMHNLIVLYSNQVRSAMDENKPNKTIPQGGNVLAHASDIRIKLDSEVKSKEESKGVNVRSFDIVDCGFLPQTKVKFLLGSFGIGEYSLSKRMSIISQEYLKHGFFIRNMFDEKINENRIKSQEKDLDDLRDQLF